MVDSSKALDDLQASGLTHADMRCRDIDVPERSACNIKAEVEGYVIPYFTMAGKQLPFYRVKMFETSIKYIQPKNTSNHIYFPPGFLEVVKGKDYIIITEGEKKAAAAVKNGFPCVGVGGVDSWKNRTISLPEGTELLPGKKGTVTAKLNRNDVPLETVGSTMAVGFTALVDYCVENDKHIIICYDTDGIAPKFEVQRATAILAYELRFMGVAHERIRQLVLPNKNGPDGKMALDDFFLTTHKYKGKDVKGVDLFYLIVKATKISRIAFPRHPNVRDFVNKKLQKSFLTRKELQQVSLAILCDLDTHGMRLRSDDQGKMYYLDNDSRKLLKASIMRAGGERLLGESFSRLLYTRYGLSANDDKTLGWLATQFSAEEPIEDVDPHKVLFCPKGEDQLKLQINDGQYIDISANTTEEGMPFEILDNGHEGIMFESGIVESLDTSEFIAETRKQLDEIKRTKSIRPIWFNVLKDTRIKKREEDGNKLIKLLTLLYYCSPWLNRWNGTQMPVEITVGEPGSGKSTLYSLRLSILLGNPLLRNAPADIKDWHASITSCGGLHVIDNFHGGDKALRQRMSDEMCRLVTEPVPSIEQRRYYTNADLVRIPVETTFAITAIMQPFPNADLLQRSIVTELEKASASTSYEADWERTQLKKYGGRVGWLAHHVIVLNQFFKRVELDWDSRYSAKHRLMNLEQSLRLMARVFGWADDWIPDFLTGSTDHNISESDWAMEGLKAFADFQTAHFEGKPFTATDIAEWATTEEDFQDCIQLNSARRLGRYIQSHKNMVTQITGIREAGKFQNRIRYRILHE